MPTYRALVFVFIVPLVLLLASPAVFAQSQGQSPPQWKLIWSDEFNGPANSPPDSTKWSYDLGGGGWGNNELEAYTSSTDNVALDGNGNLVIHVLQPTSGGYTSARLKTQGKFSFDYGKIEARIRIPYGQGIWPAFWMLGSDITTVPWPGCGELDVMENIGKEPSTVHATVHGPGYSGSGGITAAYTLPAGQKFSDDFHVFSMVWTPASVEFFVDSVSYSKVAPASLPKGANWVFNAPFFLLLNVAVGGNWPGSPDASTTFPQTMTVDYVRVYQGAATPLVSLGGVVNAASFSPSLSPGSLASLFGNDLSDDTATNLFDVASNGYVGSAVGASVSVNGQFTPLVFVSPAQINFQVPWEVPTNQALLVQVIRDGVASNAVPIMLATSAPSAFGANAVAVLDCTVSAPVICTLWGNGFGPTSPPQQDGVPSSSPLPPLASSLCKLSINGADSTISYCGPAPGLVIDQLNFAYPSGVGAGAPVVQAVLTVGGASSTIQLPPLSH